VVDGRDLPVLQAECQCRSAISDTMGERWKDRMVEGPIWHDLAMNHDVQLGQNPDTSDPGT